MESSNAVSVKRGASVGVQPAESFESPKRLSEATHKLADYGLSGEWGRSMTPAGLNLDDVIDVSRLSDEMKYAESVRLIAERAPLRISPFEKIVGSAPYVEAAYHTVPILNLPSVSHTTIGFDRVLKIGYKGLRKEIEERLQRGGMDDKGVDLLRAMLVCLDAAHHWRKRYISELNSLINRSSGRERANYQRTLDNLKNVPENPPSSFAEAVQSLWFMYAFQRLAGNWSGIGRIDEMLGPYLKNDLHSGEITIQEARELIAHFWIRGTEWIGVKTEPGSGDAQHYQNIVLAGVDAAGTEVTNEVTYLVLDVVEELNISDFPIAVRINRNTPERLLKRVAEVQKRGGGIVALYNEEIVINALVKFGYQLEEARTFANDGCWEPIIPGKTSFSYHPFDMLKILQESLGLSCSEENCATPDYSSFDELYAAFTGRLKDHIDSHRKFLRNYSRDGHPATVVSMIVEGCVEKGRGYNDRGPKYTVLALHAGGMAEAANSLLAIKRIVYQEKMLTLREMITILKSNWSGHEPLRRLVKNRVPTYGNDNDEADMMVQKAYDTFTDLVAETKEAYGVLMPAGISTFGREIEWREHRKATASGDKQGDILSTNFSPSPGTETKGPTAALKSYCKMDFTKLPNVGPIEIKIHPSSAQGESGTNALLGLAKSFVKLGGCFLHVDVVDSALLLDAQRNPDKYPNLSVRISGWCARFATLNEDWQNMIIQRTQQYM